MDVEQSKHGWRECKTSQNGKVYYYNSVSKVIQWDKPDNLASAGYCVDDNESSIICDSTLIENELYMKVQNLSLFLIRKANIEEQYITKLQVIA